ncbi:DUF309 domain-containing protein [Arcobacter sp. YIC-464]|uniref:DUF309 domain-containing protein n=1 Tax=Arcobacter sp. YIC-464 TaxID=3376631 RepID=UPI003C1D5135
MNLVNNLDEIINIINKNDFVKAHDMLEDLWREYKNEKDTREESFILKAFVNGVVCIELYKMNREQHSFNVWDTYKKYEYLIDKLQTVNSSKYKEIQKLIYKKREEFIK